MLQTVFILAHDSKTGIIEESAFCLGSYFSVKSSQSSITRVLLQPSICICLQLKLIRKGSYDTFDYSPYWHSFGYIDTDRYKITFYLSAVHTESEVKAILFLIAPD